VNKVREFLKGKKAYITAVIGLVGAVIGTIGGYTVRAKLVAANGGRDRPIAIGEDLIAAAAGIAVAFLTSIL